MIDAPAETPVGIPVLLSLVFLRHLERSPVSPR
jgi:hypothetical protein